MELVLKKVLIYLKTKNLKDTFNHHPSVPSILPEIKHFEEKTRPKSNYYGDLFFQSTSTKMNKVRR